LGEAYLEKISQRRQWLGSGRRAFEWPRVVLKRIEDKELKLVHCTCVLIENLKIPDPLLSLAVINLSQIPEPFAGQRDRLGNADFLQLTSSDESFRLSIGSYCAKT
jgi:hypothetical protein